MQKLRRRHFQSENVIEIQIVVTKSIPADKKRLKSLKSIDFNQKWLIHIKNGPFISKMLKKKTKF